MGSLLIADLRASPYLYCGEAATKTLNPEPVPLVKISFQILLTSPLLLDIIILLWCK